MSKKLIFDIVKQLINSLEADEYIMNGAKVRWQTTWLDRLDKKDSKKLYCNKTELDFSHVIHYGHNGIFKILANSLEILLIDKGVKSSAY